MKHGTEKKDREQLDEAVLKTILDENLSQY